MSRKLHLIYVIDIESSCWNRNDPDEGVNEIIEVGSTVIDMKEKRILPWKSFYIKPIKSKISPFCTKLTGITQEIVDREGVGFDFACRSLDEATHGITWASWGDYDRETFKDQCGRENIPYPFGKTHINIKNVFALTNGLKKEVSIPDALEILDLKFTGSYHRGGPDSFNAAKVLVSGVFKWEGGYEDLCLNYDAGTEV